MAAGKKTGGRQRGTPNKANAAKAAEIAASGETPLDYMLRRMRDPTVEHEARDKMAIAVAPYVHPKLAAIEHTGKDGADLIPPPSDSRELAKAIVAALSGAVKPSE